MDVEDHVGCLVSNFSVGVHPHVIHELIDALFGLLSWLGGLAGNVREGH